MAMDNPCTSCGACCSHYRVSFYWREAEKGDQINAVPIELTEDLSPTHRCMKGTNQKHHNRCIALVGKVGESVRCKIYSHRSSTCRSFEASYENGKRNPKCDQARIAFGLQPLRPKGYLDAYADQEESNSEYFGFQGDDPENHDRL
jgi:uncharacterized protein